MTQLPPDRAGPLRASLACGKALESFTVQAHDSCGARAGSADSLACSLQVICEGLDPLQSILPHQRGWSGGRGRWALQLCSSSRPMHAQCKHMV